MKHPVALSLLIIAFLAANIAYAQDRELSWRGAERGNKQAHYMDGYTQHPVIVFSYGFPEIDFTNFNREFRNAGLVGLKLGHAAYSDSIDVVARSLENYVTFSSFSHELAPGSAGSDQDEVNLYLLRFGLENREGYGYKVKKTFIMPYTSIGYTITRVDPGDYSSAYPAGVTDPLLHFGDKFRFGTSAESGISVRITDVLAVNAGYEWSNVYPRWLFWKYSVSSLIEMSGLGLISAFANEIADSAPVAAPLVSFLLKSGWSYAIYDLRADDMNWPFATAEPLAIKTFKAGVSFVF